MKLLSTKQNIIHFEFSTRKALTLTMCRPQEFYEGILQKIVKALS